MHKRVILPLIATIAAAPFVFARLIRDPRQAIAGAARPRGSYFFVYNAILNFDNLNGGREGFAKK